MLQISVTIHMQKVLFIHITVQRVWGKEWVVLLIHSFKGPRLFYHAAQLFSTWLQNHQNGKRECTCTGRLYGSSLEMGTLLLLWSPMPELSLIALNLTARKLMQFKVWPVGHGLERDVMEHCYSHVWEWLLSVGCCKRGGVFLELGL